MNQTKITYNIMLFVAIFLLIISIVYNAIKLRQFLTNDYEYTFEIIMIIFSCLVLLICVFVLFIYRKKTELQKKNKAVVVTLTILTVILMVISGTKTNKIPLHYFQWVLPQEFEIVPFIDHFIKNTTFRADLTYYNILATVTINSYEKYAKLWIKINSKKPLVYPIHILATLFSKEKKELYKIPFVVSSLEQGEDVLLANTDIQINFDEIHSAKLQISSDSSSFIQ